MTQEGLLSHPERLAGESRSQGLMWLRPIAGPATAPIKLLAGTSTVLGRGSSCDAHLEHVAVSRRHAMVSGDGDVWHVEDLDSAHGTYVNGARVSPNMPVRLVDGDHLRILAWTFLFSAEVRSNTTTLKVTGDDVATRIETSQHATAPGQETLEFLLAGSASIHAAADEEQLLDTVANILGAIGVEHGAVLKPTGVDGQVEVVRSTALERHASTREEIHQALVEAAGDGRGMRLMDGGDAGAAVCAPIVLDSVVWGHLYAASASSIGPETSFLIESIASITAGALATRRMTDMRHRLQSAHAVEREIATRVARSGSSGGAFEWRVVSGTQRPSAIFEVGQIDDHRAMVSYLEVAPGNLGAIVLIVAQTFLRLTGMTQRDPVRLLRDVQRHLVDHDLAMSRLCVFIGYVDRRDRSVTFVNAGARAWVVSDKDDRPLRSHECADWSDSSSWEAERTTWDAGSHLVVANATGEPPSVTACRDLDGLAAAVDPDRPQPLLLGVCALDATGTKQGVDA